MSDGMRRELVYLSSHATNRYFIPNWGCFLTLFQVDNGIKMTFFQDLESTFR